MDFPTRTACWPMDSVGDVAGHMASVAREPMSDAGRCWTEAPGQRERQGENITPPPQAVTVKIG